MSVLFTTAEIATKRGRWWMVKMMEENWVRGVEGEKEERAERRKYGRESED